MKADDLRVEHLDHPLGMDTRSPRLSWRLPPGSSTQVAYRLRADNGWDSGRVASPDQPAGAVRRPGVGLGPAGLLAGQGVDRPGRGRVVPAGVVRDRAAGRVGLVGGLDRAGRARAGAAGGAARPPAAAAVLLGRPGRAGPPVRHRPRDLRGVPERDPGRRRRAHPRLHPVPDPAAGADLRCHRPHPQWTQCAGDRAGRRLVPRSDRRPAQRRPVGRPGRRAGPAAPAHRRRHPGDRRDRSGLAQRGRPRRRGRPDRRRAGGPRRPAGRVDRTGLRRRGVGRGLDRPLWILHSGRLAGAAGAPGGGDRPGGGHPAGAGPPGRRPRAEHQRLGPAVAASARPGPGSC